MSRVVFDASEVDDLAKLIEAAPDEAGKAARAAGVKVARKVVARAKQDAPADRPWLSRQGVTQRTWSDREGSHTDVFTTVDPKGRPVGFFVEHGTSKTAPQPFLTKQMGWAGAEFAREVQAALGDIL